MTGVRIRRSPRGDRPDRKGHVQEPSSRTGSVSGPLARPSRRLRAVVASAVALVVLGVGGVATAGPPPTDPPTTETTTTAPPPTTPPPTAPPPTTPPPTAAPTSRPRPTTTSPPRPTTTRPPASTTTEAPATTTTRPSTTTTTAAPAVVIPGDGTTVPDGDDGAGGPSSGRQLALVVGGLLGVAGAISVLTVLYWRRTRPAPYNTALDAVGDLGGPPPVTASTPAVVGEPTVVGAGDPAAPPRSAADAAVLSAALAAAERARSTDATADTGAADTGAADTGTADAAVPASGAGGPGFRIVGPVSASGVGPSPEVRGDAGSPAVSAEGPPIVTAEDLAVEGAAPTVRDPLTELLAAFDPDAPAAGESPGADLGGAPPDPPDAVGR